MNSQARAEAFKRLKEAQAQTQISDSGSDYANTDTYLHVEHAHNYVVYNNDNPGGNTYDPGGAYFTPDPLPDRMQRNFDDPGGAYTTSDYAQ